jgi:hypothetical protein
MILLFVIVTCIPAFASCHVEDVTVSSLNIRTGPGTSYPVIGQEPYDADLLDNWNDILPSANGYRWNRVYYPVSSDGRYKSSRVGWAVASVISTGEKWQKTCDRVRVNQSMYFYLNYALTLPSSSHLYTPGEYAAKNPYDNHLDYQPNYLNSWRVNDIYYLGSQSWANGWYLNAKKES